MQRTCGYGYEDPREQGLLSVMVWWHSSFSNIIESPMPNLNGLMAGATPKLQELHLQIHEHGVEHYGPSTIEGVEHLRRLKQVDVDIFFEGADTETQRSAADAKAILKNAISISPGHPSTKFRLEDNKKYLNFPVAFLRGAGRRNHRTMQLIDLPSQSCMLHRPLLMGEQESNQHTCYSSQVPLLHRFRTIHPSNDSFQLLTIWMTA